jgi:NADPH-dependent F420 reductase
METIAVLGGTGAMGRGLAARWARAGRAVIVGSRDAEKAQGVAETIGSGVHGVTNLEAAARADIAVLTVPFAHQESVLRELKGSLEGKVLVDVTVPLRPPRVHVVDLPAEGSAARRAQAILGERVRVVSAFQNVSASHLAIGHDVDCDVLVTGDDRAACDLVVGLAEAAGMRAWHAGPLANAVAAEALTAVLIQINKGYKIAGAGVRITGSRTHG